MTGGGSFFDRDNRVTHGFQLRCDESGPNRLQVNWGKNNRFHLTSLVSFTCGVDDDGHPEFTGVGKGKCGDGTIVDVTFKFSDHGEPGNHDLADLFISCNLWTSAIEGTYDEVTSLSDHKASNHLDRGDHQAHDWDGGGRTGTDVQASGETASEEVTADSSGSGDGAGESYPSRPTGCG